MTLTRALIAARVAPSTSDVLAAQARQFTARGAWNDTRHRATIRAMLDAAAVADAVVLVAFVKLSGELRYMACTPCPGQDNTYRYYTVIDEELSEARGRPVHRRVCLDTIARLVVDFRLSPSTH